MRREHKRLPSGRRDVRRMQRVTRGAIARCTRPALHVFATGSPRPGPRPCMSPLLPVLLCLEPHEPSTMPSAMPSTMPLTMLPTMPPAATCPMRRSMTHGQAAPLRAGGRFCAHHEPDTALAGVTRCAGQRPDGQPCRLTSACSFATARPLREGGAYCSHHLWQGWTPPADCAGVDGAYTAALGAEIDDSVAAALDVEYCDACKASWRALGLGRLVLIRGPRRVARRARPGCARALCCHEAMWRALQRDELASARRCRAASSRRGSLRRAWWGWGE
eukprot:5362696-Prymnesium_polylepis.1